MMKKEGENGGRTYTKQNFPAFRQNKFFFSSELNIQVHTE
jgi:hypothetical protein